MIDGGVRPCVFQVGQEIGAGDHGEACLQLTIGTGGVDDQQVEGEQTQYCDENQDCINNQAGEKEVPAIAG